MTNAGRQQDQEQLYGQVVARAWQDEAFKQRLLAEPRAVLEEHGIAIPPGIEVRMVEDTDKVVHLTLPARPSGEELTLEQLEAVVGASWKFWEKEKEKHKEGWEDIERVYGPQF